MAQFAARITMEVAPSKLASIIRHARLPGVLDTIMEDDKEAMETLKAPARNVIAKEAGGDTSVHYCADKPAFLAPMAKAQCLKIKA